MGNSSKRRQVNLLGLIGFLAFLLFNQARAHDEPTSYLDLTPAGDRLELVITASTTDLAHDLSNVEPAMLLDASVIATYQETLCTLLTQRCQIGLPLTFDHATPLPAQRDLALSFHAALPEALSSLSITCQLFPYDPRHRTFLNIRAGGQVQRTEIFSGPAAALEVPLNVTQSRWQVFCTFVAQGLHHIFIGPDHILFVIGLLLLGGGVRKLLGIITAFTLAHSITLGLATFHILSPPARVIEPTIALSIVIVGLHALLGKGARDPRLWLAFGFGLIHGFGFAFALEELSLPRSALGLSLLAFNGGVELGQGCIILLCAPLLAWVKFHWPLLSQRLIATAALGLTMAGTFWFCQRLWADG